ncbi:MAG: hypothetical protein GY856_05480 [bacterium]|nr:hypothetical protein [bacterium]
MVACRKDQNPAEQPAGYPAERSNGGRNASLGQGGPVFLPRRKPSRLAQALLVSAASADHSVTAYDDLGLIGRPPT